MPLGRTPSLGAPPGRPLPATLREPTEPPRVAGASPRRRELVPPRVAEEEPSEPRRAVPISLRERVPETVPRLDGAAEERLRSPKALRELLALLRLLLLKVLREGLELLRTELDELRLGLLNELLLRLLDPLNELRLLELEPDERLIDDELCPPPLRLPPPPPRCAIAGVKLSVRATIARAINFVVFILLLLSFRFVFSVSVAFFF